MSELVTIEDSTIYAMLHNAKFADIPCLVNKRDIFLPSRAAPCGSCSHKRQERQRQEMAKIKACLAGMSSQKKAELKQLLDAEKVRIVYVNASNQVVQLTF